MRTITKTIILLGVILLACNGLWGCGGGGGNGNSPYINPNANAYFPLIPGSSMTFVITDAPETSDLWDSVENHTYKVRKATLDVADLPKQEVYFFEPQTPTGIVRGPVFNGTKILGTSQGDSIFDGVMGYLTIVLNGIVILPNPSPAIGNSWVMAAPYGEFWMPGSVEENTLLSISAMATLVAVEDINIQGKSYNDALRIDVSGHIESTYFTAEIIGLGSYWLVEGVGLVAIEGNCGGFFTETVRIKRKP